MYYLSQLTYIRNTDKKRLILIGTITSLAIILTSYLVILNGTVFADGYAEGNILYDNADWHLVLGRWATRYINGALLNVINPLFNTLFSIICLSLGTFYITKLLKINNNFEIACTTIVFAICPSVVYQYEYMYILNVFSVAYLLSVFCAISFVNKRYVIGLIALAISLGCYQSYIGMTIGLLLINLIIEIIENENPNEIICNIKNYLIFGIAGCLLYIVILNMDLNKFSLTISNYANADKISVMNTMVNLPSSLKNIYIKFISYYSSTGYFKLGYYSCLLMIALLPFFVKSNIKDKIVVALLIIVMPIALYFICLIAPDRPIYSVMIHQEMLIIPFAFYVSSLIKWKKISKFCLYISTVILCLFLFVRAYCTHYAFTCLNNYYKSYIQSAIDAVYQTEEFNSENPILFAGVLDENKILSEIDAVYSLSYVKTDFCCYDSSFGVYNFWRPFAREKLGLNIGKVTEEDYLKIIKTQEFKEMNTFPSKNSIREINGVTVIKVEENPPQK